MEKRQIHLEYALNTVSGPILWTNISTPTGLQHWVAEKVIADEDIFTFEWSKDEIRQAKMICKKAGSLIRFHWMDDEDPKSFFEFKIEYNELTGDYTLVITDMADEDEVEELTDLWNLEVASLQRQCGI